MEFCEKRTKKKNNPTLRYSYAVESHQYVMNNAFQELFCDFYNYFFVVPTFFQPSSSNLTSVSDFLYFPECFSTTPWEKGLTSWNKLFYSAVGFRRICSWKKDSKHIGVFFFFSFQLRVLGACIRAQNVSLLHCKLSSWGKKSTTAWLTMDFCQCIHYSSFNRVKSRVFVFNCENRIPLRLSKNRNNLFAQTFS